MKYFTICLETSFVYWSMRFKLSFYTWKSMISGEISFFPFKWRLTTHAAFDKWHYSRTVHIGPFELYYYKSWEARKK